MYFFIDSILEIGLNKKTKQKIGQKIRYRIPIKLNIDMRSSARLVGWGGKYPFPILNEEMNQSIK
ncbi:hypothetical protein BpHYR1_004159 [Brachionus plicatilis]|uniref:Uncharacterized protein n=1 Tax=Brachionus plicatilis TaxID=10195 RepID=A0A3M7PGV5_BRAPC|nr:hypothetical protein BpHYR1_004159 [Brachionus plicatilis]